MPNISRGSLLAAAGLMLISPVGAALADTTFSIYSGSSYTLNSDIHVQQPSIGTDATFHDVSWDTKPFKAPPYYGVRLNHFFERWPNWGVGLDFTHDKVYAQTDQVVPVSGTINGVPVNESAPMNKYVQKFQITHGVNIIALDVFYRWTGNFASDSFPNGRLQPYFGGGPTYYILHPENTINNTDNHEIYKESGFGYQVMGGVQYWFTRHVGLFAETKFNSGRAKVNTAVNGTATTTLDTFQLIGGVSVGF